MYVPHYDALLQSLGTTRDAVAAGTEVTIPKELFHFLLQLAVAGSDFNEAGYRAANPDVAAAEAKGEVESARLHYIGYGYFEGRKGGTPEVDERWYLRSYPDVGSAVRAGRLASASEHFTAVGASEGRSPGPRYEHDAAQWKKALLAA